jgi:hypothetical protein
VPVAVKGKVPVGVVASPLPGCTAMLTNVREGMLFPPQPARLRGEKHGEEKFTNTSRSGD